MKTIVILPAYNAAQTLEKTIADIPLAFVDEIIIVDDASSDETHTIANKLSLSGIKKENGAIVPVTTERLPKNTGYGGNQKRCYDLALEHGADIVVMLHPDYQYDPKLIKYFVELISDNYFDIVLGSRIRSRREARDGGMPAYKYYANRALTLFENIVSGYNLSEWHTGMRAYSRSVLKNMEYHTFSDDFIFDSQLLFAAVENKCRIGDIPVPVRYFEEASSINFRRSMRYGLLTLWEASKYFWRRCLRKSTIRYIFSGGIGFAVNLGTYVSLLHFTNIWYIKAATVAFLAGAVASFILQKWWTFGETSTDVVHKQLIKYVSVLLFNTAINSLLVYIFVDNLGIHKVTAAITSTIVIAVWSFFIYKKIIFIKKII